LQSGRWNINLHPLRAAVLEKRGLVTGRIPGRLPEAKASGLIHLSQISDNPVTGPPRRPIGFQQDPAVMGLAVFLPAGFSDEHTKPYLIASILFKRVGLHYMPFLPKLRIHQAKEEGEAAKML